MKRSMQIFGFLVIISLLANWSTQPGDKTSFFGEITTRQGNILKLTNIRVGKDRAYALIKQIPVYEKPIEHANPTPITGTNNQEIVLTVEPETQLYKKFIDLNEIAEVSIPEPETIWTYKKEKVYGKLEYIEVIVSKPGSTAHYLIDRKMKLFGDAIQEKQPESDKPFPQKGPEESEVPLPAIKQVRIQGYYLKQENGAAIQMPACSLPPKPSESKTKKP